ncbi:hypothetical protein [Lactobacillus taiwanensis]|uniref:hypothetical protein n=1 Tax=Lactobacillus taiwanensis TaxID=508451 RepID=UPI00241FFB02|nr:hypothetical protein [Lactobacillus taiwanensis]
MKTALTKEIELALISSTKSKKGVYGALEVTPTKTSYGSGYERCDYVTFGSNSEIVCYEIKVSISDFESKNKQTYLGDKNYLVIPKKLLDDVRKTHKLRSGIGIISYDCGTFKVEKRCSRRNVNISERVALLEGIDRAACRELEK